MQAALVLIFVFLGVSQAAWAQPAAEVNPHAAPSAAPSAPPAEEGPLRTGQVSVQIVNKTAGSDAVLEGLEVRLFSFTSADRKQELVGTSAEGGTYTFEGVEVSPSRKYIVSTLFQGVRYVAHGVNFPEGEQTLAIEVPVYESTGSAEKLAMDHMHLVIDSDPQTGGYAISEILVFNNTGDKTVIGGKDTTLTVSLDVPDSITNLNVVEGFLRKQVLTGQGTLAYSGPLYPGQTQAVLSYSVPNVESFYFRRRFPLPLGQLSIFTLQGGPTILSRDLSQPEVVDLQGRKYNHYLASASALGAGITFQVARAEGEAGASGPRSGPPEIPAVPMAVVVGLIAAAFVLRPFFLKAVDVEGVLTAEQRRIQQLEREKERRLHDVQEIDFDYAVGKLSTEDYAPLRDAYKARALGVLAELSQAQGQPMAISDEAASEHTGQAVQRFCTACGARVQPSHRFCASCGAPLQGSQA